jgi:uncharacterized protein (DUF1697 family)
VTRFVALLRGINLGARNRIAMADLRRLLVDLGYDDVQTVLQSGNALFTARQGTAAAHEKLITSAIERELDLKVPTLVRSAGEVEKAAEANPYVRRGVPVKELAAAFLAKAPAVSKLRALDPASYSPDGFEPGDRVLYLHRPNGVMQSKLPDLRRALGVDVTERNWNTVSKLVAAVAD